jgi:hypothetical protein
MRHRRSASVIAAAALLLSSGHLAAELLPGVGTLDRRLAVDVRLPPWNAIAKVQTNIATRCTGALVGPDTVITAAHCLYNRRTRTLLGPGSLHVLFGYERGGYFWHAQVVRYVVGDGFDGAEPARHPGADWARLELAEAVPPAIEPLEALEGGSRLRKGSRAARLQPGSNSSADGRYFLSNYRDIDHQRRAAADPRLLGDSRHERQPVAGPARQSLGGGRHQHRRDRLGEYCASGDSSPGGQVSAPLNFPSVSGRVFRQDAL